ncbi:Flp family type IVb pilin [Vibrio parahaemolyticus]|uniref:Flp family type IVb pilin n=1 Tax=Vibrio TaxID=662 RepID=UPI001CDD39DF|nr:MULTISPECIES: Flp family type IVb pilin [Vibrio]MDG2668131.1 Flp family type IVb pilin [Vibrio parahaemolyticus]MCA2422716.1 Flp family type IVb pilin [Vibrio alginolyticus]MCA2447342.1 Flp family type IVb pilin [Vibrio alginolyticus]MDG2793962.1 Flp family type IVb pilin [Vibrio parahaemolyticus]MDW2161474.1 Flp family type IVb pilin [Vibrio sp. 1942]
MITKLYVTASTYLNSLKNDERGVTAIEYGLIAIAMAAMLAAVFYGDGNIIEQLRTGFGKITTALTSANTSTP